MASNPPLRLVDADTGEVVERCPNCAAMEDQLAGAENNVRSMRAQMAELKRTLEDELDTENKNFPAAMALFRYWQERCNHPHSEFTPARMKLVIPFLKRHTTAEIREAIRGAAFDPYVTTLKNGNEQKHDDWELIFRNEGKFETFRNRAPDPGPPSLKQKAMLGFAGDVAGRVLERAELIRSGKDKAAVAHLLLEVNRLIVDWLATPYTEKESDDGHERSAPAAIEDDAGGEAGSAPGA